MAGETPIDLVEKLNEAHRNVDFINAVATSLHPSTVSPEGVERATLHGAVLAAVDSYLAQVVAARDEVAGNAALVASGAGLVAASVGVFRFDDVQGLKDDVNMTYTPDTDWSVAVGMQVSAGRFHYRVVASGGDIVTAGGVHLKVLTNAQGRYPLDAYDLDDFDLALSRALADGWVELGHGAHYVSQTGVSVSDQMVGIVGNGATIRRAPDASNAPLLDVGFSFSAPVSVVSVGLADMWRGNQTARLTNSGNFAQDETVSIMGEVYTFTTSLVAANDVLIGADISESLGNLEAAINAAAGEAITYGAGTVAHDKVMATMDGAALIVSASAVLVLDADWVFASDAPGASWLRENSSTKGGVIQLDPEDFAALGIAVGDSVKLLCDDKIPWGIDADDEYLAEHVRVDGVSGGSTILVEVPPRIWALLAVGTNVRLAKMTQGVVDIRGLNICDSVGFDPEINAPLVKITGAVEPVLVDLKCHLGASGFVELQSCFRPQSSGIEGYRLRTSLRQEYNAFGYVLIEYGCTGGVHVLLKGGGVRHVYTTGCRGNPTVPTDDVARYGGVIGSRVQGVAIGCEHSGFDTHADALGLTFDVEVRQGSRGMLGSVFAVQLRGQSHIVNAVVESQSFFTCNVDGAGTGDHQIKIIARRPDLGQGITTELVRFRNYGTGHASVRFDLDAVIGDWGGPVVEAEDVDVGLDRIALKYAPNTDYTGSVFFPSGAKIQCNELLWDMQGATASTPRVVRQKGAGGEVEITRATVLNAPDFYVGDLGNHADARVVVGELVTDSPVQVSSQSGGFDVFANRHAAAVGLAHIKPVAGLGLDNPAFLAYANSSGGAKSIEWHGRADPEIFLVPDNSSGVNVDVSSLSPPAFDGQFLTIAPVGAHGYILKTGATTNVDVPADKLVEAGYPVRLFGQGGIWKVAAH